MCRSALEEHVLGYPPGSPGGVEGWHQAELSHSVSRVV